MENTMSEWFVAKALMALSERRAEQARGEPPAPAPVTDAVSCNADPFAIRLWNLLRIRRALTADEAAALLVDTRADDDIALGRRQAGALLLSWSRQCPQAVRVDARRVDGMKRYALLRDIGATPPAPAPRGEAR